jgi:hypothetical protein
VPSAQVLDVWSEGAAFVFDVWSEGAGSIDLPEFWWALHGVTLPKRFDLAFVTFGGDKEYGHDFRSVAPPNLTS